MEAPLCVAYDQKYISLDQSDRLIAMTSSTNKLIAGFMLYLKQTRIKELKFK